MENPSAAVRKAHRKRRIIEEVKGWGWLAPSLIGVLIFFIIPFCVVIYYSVLDNPIFSNFVGLDNYIKLFSNAAFLRAAKNTAIFSGIAVPLSVVLSLWMAFALNSRIPGKSWLRSCFLCPLMVPIASVVLVWQVIFHYHGTLNQVTALFGMEPVDWLKTNWSYMVLTVMFLWKTLGYNMILFMSAIAGIPKDIIEVAELEGADEWYKFVHIKLRYLSPTILFVTILSIISSFKMFREVYLLTGDYPFESMYLMQHFMNNTFNSLDYQKLSSAAVLLSLVMIVLIGALFLIEHWFGKDVEE
ncbi:MAG: sugar ABC transporter permease [Oscillospiraceae bacterium]|nr:sugar ABC transporter permease [Oscillospiraceae bacterium]MBQ9695643.1 sugar ABC transporter permease [Oscillospiraceae bacterium]MBR1898654.1 sugar ABC transporter permease [Oscillospiraceae bacterium]